ncbi:MAG: proton-conducting membrane transporter, partial [Pseudomonadota bacterium]
AAPAPAPKPAPEPKPAAQRAPAKKKTAAKAKKKDDLKKISGVGPALEKKLQGMGVTTYQQIADWKAADIKEVDEKLNFKGRIQREGWVKQAKTLAAGGETEFSRRKK